MISHPNEHVQGFIDWIRSFYGVKTKKLSSVWWGRLLQKWPNFAMAGIQLGNSIWINDVDGNKDGERDYWKDDQPFGCIALVTHELWHVLQKRTDRLARWHYLKPQIYAVFMVPGFILSAWLSPWLMILWGALIAYFLLPAHAPERLRLESEAYAWNSFVAGLLCDNDPATLYNLRVSRAKFIASGAYYWPTRHVEEAERFLEGYASTPDLEPTLSVKIRHIIACLKAQIS